MVSPDAVSTERREGFCYCPVPSVSTPLSPSACNVFITGARCVVPVKVMLLCLPRCFIEAQSQHVGLKVTGGRAGSYIIKIHHESFSARRRGVCHRRWCGRRISIWDTAERFIRTTMGGQQLLPHRTDSVDNVIRKEKARMTI